MALTPLFAAAGSRLQDLLARRQAAAASDRMSGRMSGRTSDRTAAALAGLAGPSLAAAPAMEGPAAGLEGHVLVAGYGESARALVRALKEAGIPFVILTLSPDGADEAVAAGMTVVPGDYARLHLLQHAGIERARLLVVADDEPDRTHHVVSVARMANPALTIVARTRAAAAAAGLRQAGADRVVADEVEGLAQLFTRVLEAYDTAPGEVEELTGRLRGQWELTAFLPAPPPQPVGRAAATLERVYRLSGQQRASGKCAHVDQAREVTPRTAGCEECLALGEPWVHLRVCLSCGHVGCCDTSRNRHATRHFEATAHPLVRSGERGESWSWCYVDRTEL